MRLWVCCHTSPSKLDILRLAMNGDQEQGYPTSLPLLQERLRPWTESSDGREIIACLRTLHEEKQVTLWKWQGQWIKFVRGNTDAEFFYSGQFYIRSTPLTIRRLQELEANDDAMTDEELKARFKNLESYGVERVKHDLQYNLLQIVGGTRAHRELVWKWVRVMEKEANSALPSVSSHARKAFVVHGHDDAARESVARFLERADFEAIILHEQANSGRTIIEKIEAYGDVGFAVVLLTPDDEGCKLGETPKPRARQNVVLELGYFLGRLGRNRVCPLKLGDLEIPSDFGGVVYVPFDSAGGWRQALGRELEQAGFPIDWSKVMGTRS